MFRVAAYGDRRALVATVTAAGIAQLPTAAIVVALPAIHSEFGTSLETLQWTVTAFLIPYSALMIAAGRTADAIGRRVVLLAGTGLFAVGSVVAALAPGGIVLIGGITVAGVGAAAMIPSSMSVITDAFVASKRALAIGLWGGATEFVSGVGIVIGGVLTDVSWRLIFVACAAVSVGIVALCLTAVVGSRDESASRTIDYAGALISSLFLAALSLALIQGPSWGFTASSTLGLFAASVLALVAFVVVELRAPIPIVDFSLLRRRNFSGSMVVIFALDFSLGALLFFLPMYFQEIDGFSATKTGAVLLPLTALMVIGSPLGGKIAARTGPRPPIVVGLAIMAVGLAMTTRITLDTTLSQLWLPTCVIGFGVGLALTPMNLAAMNAAPKDKAGAASGLLVTLSGLGATLGVAVTGAIFNELQAQRIVSNLGSKVDEAQARALSGLLADTPSAQDALDRSVGVSPPEALRAVQEAFVSALSASLLISVGLVALSMLLTIAVMRREEGDGADVPELREPSAFRPAPRG